jgi:hypothetical protein
MLLIDDEQLKALIDRLASPKQYQQCLEEIQRMVEIKQALLWRADASVGCCGWPTVMRFTYEVQLLEDALESYKEQQIEKTAKLLEDYRVYIGSLP